MENMLEPEWFFVFADTNVDSNTQMYCETGLNRTDAMCSICFGVRVRFIFLFMLKSVFGNILICTIPFSFFLFFGVFHLLRVGLSIPVRINFMLYFDLFFHVRLLAIEINERKNGKQTEKKARKRKKEIRKAPVKGFRFGIDIDLELFIREKKKHFSHCEGSLFVHANVCFAPVFTVLHVNSILITCAPRHFTQIHENGITEK